MCTIVNFREYGSAAALTQAFGHHWLYVGRANHRAGLPASPLANPYQVATSGRQQAISQYRCWLWQRIQSGDEAVIAALKSISADTVLVCWCKPEACHGDVVRAAAEWLKSSKR
ncbi:MAG: DUF4326 domain-containing protein [Chloroflexota bacterium]